jgi:hypothetical protein
MVRLVLQMRGAPRPKARAIFIIASFQPAVKQFFNLAWDDVTLAHEILWEVEQIPLDKP